MTTGAIVFFTTIAVLSYFAVGFITYFSTKDIYQKRYKKLEESYEKIKYRYDGLKMLETITDDFKRIIIEKEDSNGKAIATIINEGDI